MCLTPEVSKLEGDLGPASVGLAGGGYPVKTAYNGTEHGTT